MSYLPTSAPLLLKTGSETISGSKPCFFTALLLGLSLRRTRTNLVRRFQNHIAAVRARHAAIDQHEIVLFVDLHHIDIANRHTLIAIATGHALALLHAAATAVGRQGAGAAHVAMHLLDTVRRPLTGKIVALHRTRETTALGEARDIDGLHAFQHFNRDLAADLGFADRTTQFANESLRLTTSLIGGGNAGRGKLLRPLAFELGNVTTFTAARQATRLIEKAELHCFVAVALL